MKKLILLRHSKSSWDNPDLEDKYRGLSERGFKNAKLLKNHIELLNISIDIGYISCSQRTIESYLILNSKRKILQEEAILDELYLANCSEILTIVQSIDNRHSSALILGHNPGLEEFGNYLLGTSNLFVKFPTTAWLELSLPVENWNRTKAGIAKLCSFWIPKMGTFPKQI